MTKSVNILISIGLLGMILLSFFVKPILNQTKIDKLPTIYNYQTKYSLSPTQEALKVTHPELQKILAKNGFRLYIENGQWIASTFTGDYSNKVLEFNQLPIDHFLDSVGHEIRPIRLLNFHTVDSTIQIEMNSTMDNIYFPVQKVSDTLNLQLNYCGPGASSIFENTLLHYKNIDEHLSLLRLEIDLPEGTEDFSEAVQILNQLTTEKGKLLLTLEDKNGHIQKIKANGKPYILVDSTHFAIKHARNLAKLFENGNGKETAADSFALYSVFQDLKGNSYSIPTHTGTLP